MNKRILVCGSRWFGRPKVDYVSEEARIKDFKERVEPQRIYFNSKMAEICSKYGKVEYLYNGHIDCTGVTIISGMAPGADTLAVEFAEFYGIPLMKFPADWKKYGNGAGPLRNTKMLDEGKPHVVVGFLMSDSRGTRDMLTKAKFESNIDVIECEWDNENKKW